MLIDLSINSQYKKEKLGKVTLPGALEEEHDLALVHRMADGDDSALHELYAEYGSRLFSYALRLLGDPDQAEDVVQDALIVVWKTAARFRCEGRVLAWLLGIVHHLSMKSLRHASQPITSTMEETIKTPTPLPEECIEQEQEKKQIRECLNLLSVEHRSILELVFFQGLSLNEVSQVCQIPLGTVKSRLSYARSALRGELIRQKVKE